jgi:hypothetical protein
MQAFTEKKAFCLVNISPVRALQEDTSEMVTQLLFGEIFTAHEIQKSWCRITTFTDNYEGWIDLKHAHFLSEKEAKKWQDIAIPQLELIRELETPWGKQLNSRGASIPFDNREQFNIGTIEFNLISALPFVKPTYPFELALEYHNTPYLWGGKSAFGIDCSGLTQMVYRFYDYNLPRDAAQQVEVGREVEYNEMQENDLAFFGNANGKITHVGIIGENQTIIHAAGRVRVDVLTRAGIFNDELQALTHNLKVIKRL